jgi:hypothetical protein
VPRSALQALEDLDGFGHRRLVDVDLLEAPRQRAVLLENAAELGVGGRADALQLAGRQRRLEQVGRVQRAAGRRPGADQGVDLVDEQNRVRVVLERLEHRFQALLEIAAILGAGEQGAHVQRVNIGFAEDFRHIAFDHLARQALGDGGLADAGLADQQRIVLAPAAQGLDDALQFLVAADQWIDLALQGQRIEVDGVLLKRPGFRLFAFGLDFALRRCLLLRHLADAVEMKFTTSSRVTPCFCRKYTACESFSP